MNYGYRKNIPIDEVIGIFNISKENYNHLIIGVDKSDKSFVVTKNNGILFSKNTAEVLYNRIKSNELLFNGCKFSKKSKNNL